MRVKAYEQGWGDSTVVITWSEERCVLVEVHRFVKVFLEGGSPRGPESICPCQFIDSSCWYDKRCG